MTDDFAAGVSGVGALAEPVRRSLYQYVARQPEPVSREQAAEGCGLPTHTAKFHLDRLVEVGLLDTEFRRLSGRTGPGAGRPAKLYRRSDRVVSVSLPERRYELAGEVLAEAIDRSLRAGAPLRDAVTEAAERRGRALVTAEAAAVEPADDEVARAARVLGSHGYEPRATETGFDLANCPFDALAREHTELVCGLNHALVRGVLDELRCGHLDAVLEPEPGMCCVKARRRP